MNSRIYPPALDDELLENLISTVEDWQLSNGALLKLTDNDSEESILAYPVGVSLFPTVFPKQLFEQALSIQEAYNEVYTAAAEDEDWLYRTLETMIQTDLLTKVLWGIHKEVEQHGYVQDLSLGVFRSDYMLHLPPNEHSMSCQNPQLKQVEFNTVSCAGGVHGNKISRMHRYLYQTGAYHPRAGDLGKVTLTSTSLPMNNTVMTITAGLAAAHRAYGAPKASEVVQTCVIFVVQAPNFNIADERPIEYALWEQDPSIPAFRVQFGQGILDSTTLTSSRELLFHPSDQLIYARPMEVSVIYMRSGFEIHEYDRIGRSSRLRLEMSRAIKCPSILSHLTTFKKVQQQLASTEALEKFLPKERAQKIAETFAPIYPMDESSAGLHARNLATNAMMAANHVLKPSLEGGGHNIYGKDIPKFLAEIPQETWNSYVLMEKITPPIVHNILMSRRGIYSGPVISELGIFGVCLWTRKTKETLGAGAQNRAEILSSFGPSWSFKTKDATVDEMSVVKGYGCFDSPVLVDWETFSAASSM